MSGLNRAPLRRSRWTLASHVMDAAVWLGLLALVAYLHGRLPL